MRKTWLFGLLLIPLAILGVLFQGDAQTLQVPQVPPVAPAPPPIKPRDGSKMSDTAQPIYFSAHRAMEWLKRTNMPDHRFVYGFQPSLRVRLEGDNFVSQAGAAFALARSARYFHDKRGTALASGAALTLLMETMIDPKDTALRYCAAPANAVDRLSSNGLLISAIHELESVANYADLVKHANELCTYLWQQQRADGSLCVAEGPNFVKSGSEDVDAERAGWALQGIIRSHKHRPASWKIDTVRKARGYYQVYWQQHKNMATVCSHTPAYAEAFVQTKDPGYAEVVYAMNDWLVNLQYPEGIDIERKHWTGGFPRTSGGKQEQTVPDIRSALPAESLAEACRVAKIAGDLPRLRRYERALVMNIHFLMSLQYTSARTEHFVDPFRPSILGAFYASHQDGNILIDYTQHALGAMVLYLDAVID